MTCRWAKSLDKDTFEEPNPRPASGDEAIEKLVKAGHK